VEVVWVILAVLLVVAGIFELVRNRTSSGVIRGVAAILAGLILVPGLGIFFS
jgi:hypothetical protein